MKKNYFRRNKWNVVTLGFTFIVTFAIMRLGYLKTDITTSDILTLNSLFAGFLFTALGILASFLTIEKIANLDQGGYIDNYMNSIYMGLFFHLFSILMILTNISFVVPTHFSEYLIEFSHLSFIAGFIFFIKSVFGIAKIIKKIRFR